VEKYQKDDESIRRMMKRNCNHPSIRMTITLMTAFLTSQIETVTDKGTNNLSCGYAS